MRPPSSAAQGIHVSGQHTDERPVHSSDAQQNAASKRMLRPRRGLLTAAQECLMQFSVPSQEHAPASTTRSSFAGSAVSLPASCFLRTAAPVRQPRLLHGAFLLWTGHPGGYAGRACLSGGLSSLLLVPDAGRPQVAHRSHIPCTHLLLELFRVLPITRIL